MNKLYTVFMLIYLLFGCETSQSINKNVTQNIEYTEIEKDSILKHNLGDFQISLKNENYDLAYNYLYDKIIIHMQKKFPDENIDERYIKENILKFTHDILLKIEKNKKVKLEYIIGDIKFKDSSDNTLLYIINASLDSKINNKRKSIPSKVLCFSYNNGTSWQFMEYDQEATPLILKENFSNQFTNKILSHF